MMRERRLTRWNAFWGAISGSAFITMPCGILTAGIAYGFGQVINLNDTDVIGLTAVMGAVGLFGPLSMVVTRDYMRLRDQETRPEREYREKALLRKLASRYPGEVNDL